MKKIVFYGLKDKKQRLVYGPILVELVKAGQSKTLQYWAALLVKKFKLNPQVQKKGVVIINGKISPVVPKPKSSLGVLIQVMLSSPVHMTDKMLIKYLGKARNKYYSMARFQKLLSQAKSWLTKNGYKVLTSTTNGGMIVKAGK